MDTINLDKGQAFDLSKGAADGSSLKRVRVALGWDENTGGGYAYDLDASAFALKESKLPSDQHLVFYNNLQLPDNSVVHSGDNLTGDGDGDDEVITVDLTKLDEAGIVDEISVVVTIHDAAGRNQNFGQVSNSYIAIYNDETGEKLAQYNLNEDFTVETGVQFGSIYKDDEGHWQFEAIGAGFEAGLAEFINEYRAA